MKTAWLRSWVPYEVPKDRCVVLDDLDRIAIDQHDYRPLCDVDLDGVFLVEWDLAVAPEEANWFERQALETPDRVRVAPYRCYDAWSSWWIHWHGTSELDLRFVDYGEPFCDGFGFGLTYLPMPLLRAWRKDRGHLEKLTDLTFSTWHVANGLGKVPIDWAVRPVHVHWSWKARPHQLVQRHAMENDARVGDRPAVIDDAPVLSRHEVLPADVGKVTERAGDRDPISNGKSVAFFEGDA